MTISKISTLVSAQWLRDQILPSAHKLSSSLRVLDTSWLPTPDVDGYKVYQKAHIPTSLHFDLKTISPAKEGTFHKFSIPEPKQFKDYVEDLGISDHTHVVVYNSIDRRPAFRSWFLFRLFGHDRISVLNGGTEHWQRLGYQLTKEEPKVERGEFEPNFRGHLLRDFEAMTANVESRAEQMVDTRPAELFNGIVDDPSGGHMPGSVNIPFTQLFHEDGLFKSAEEVKALLDKANVDLNKPFVATCLMGMTACTLAGAAFQLGKEDVPVYNGSSTEWCVRADPKNIVRLNKNEQ